jgi:hypothetical protein
MQLKSSSTKPDKMLMLIAWFSICLLTAGFAPAQGFQKFWLLNGVAGLCASVALFGVSTRRQLGQPATSLQKGLSWESFRKTMNVRIDVAHQVQLEALLVAFKLHSPNQLLDSLTQADREKVISLATQALEASIDAEMAWTFVAPDTFLVGAVDFDPAHCPILSDCLNMKLASLLNEKETSWELICQHMSVNRQSNLVEIRDHLCQQLCISGSVKQAVGLFNHVSQKPVAKSGWGRIDQLDPIPMSTLNEWIN